MCKLILRHSQAAVPSASTRTMGVRGLRKGGWGGGGWSASWAPCTNSISMPNLKRAIKSSRWWGSCCIDWIVSLTIACSRVGGKGKGSTYYYRGASRQKLLPTRQAASQTMWQQNLHAIANEPTKLANFAIYFAHIISALFSLTRSIVSRAKFFTPPSVFKIDFKSV